MNAWARDKLMMLRRQMSKEMTQVHQNLWRAISTFLYFFKHAVSFTQRNHRACKSRIFQMGTRNPHGINKRHSLFLLHNAMFPATNSIT